MQRLFRIAQILLVLFRHGLDELVVAVPFLRWARHVYFAMPWNWIRNKAPLGVRIRHALEDLGPIFVKFGQMLSVRPDLVSDQIARELQTLQDEVPPFPSEQAIAIVESRLGEPVNDVFSFFDPLPLASASIAQVHAARLHDGTEVVVKVVRPGIEPTIGRDVGLLKWLALLVERYSRDARRLHPKDVVDEYEKVIFDELDMLREGASAAQLRRNFQDSPLLDVPAVHWDYSSEDVLVMDRISGIPIDDIEALVAEGVDLRKLAETGVEIFFTQVFRHNFFHADMHPGNIFVDPHAEPHPRYVAVDFGIMGSLGPEDQRYLAQNFVAFFNRDYRRVAELHVMSHWVPEETRIEEFEAAIRTVCEPIFERPLKDISFAQLLIRLFQTARRFNVEVQPQLVLLQKTLLHIEGLGRQLYPDLDLWATAKPVLEQWLKERAGPSAIAEALRSRAGRWLEIAPELPELIHKSLVRQVEDARHARSREAELTEIRRELRRVRHVSTALLVLLGVGIMALVVDRFAITGVTLWALIALVTVVLIALVRGSLDRTGPQGSGGPP